MFSQSTIRSLQLQAAKAAALRHQEPFIYWNSKEVDTLDRFPFPNIGDYIAPNWERLPEAFFCDKFGLREPGDGRSLSPSELRAAVKDCIIAHAERTVGFAIIEEGQFQLCVGAFARKYAQTGRRPGE